MKGNVGSVEKIGHLPHMLQYNTNGDHALNGDEFAGFLTNWHASPVRSPPRPSTCGSVTAPTEAGTIYRALRSVAVPAPGTDTWGSHLNGGAAAGWPRLRHARVHAG